MKSAFSILFVSILSSTVVYANSPYHWNGLYVGLNGGAAFSQFNAKTSTTVGPALDPIQVNAVNAAGDQTLNTQGFLTGIQGGYNWQYNQLLLGVETDIQSLSTNDVINTGAILYPNLPDRQFVLSAYGNNNWLFTARPRIGITTNNWLFYATGGLGLAALRSDYIFSNNAAELESKKVSVIQPGYVIGVGIETSLTRKLSLKAEYLFENFNNMTATHMNHLMPAGQNFTNTLNLQSSILRLGLNYHFNDPLGNSSDLSLIPDLFNADLWEAELGARIFASTGTVGAPQPLLNSPGSRMASRLIFSDLTAIAGETFARIDHIEGLFAKGYLGAGSITNGRLNDEDFPAGGAYSNTYSTALGNLSYVTLDMGYSPLKTATGKLGAFIGYNYYAENINIYNCRQLAGAQICRNPSQLSNFIALSEDDQFNSFRLGLSSEFNISDQLTLSSDAAYIPLVNFKGLDMHNARQLLGPEQSSHGDGAMLESSLNYQFSPSWSIGLGGRYWMWNMHSGSVDFDFLGNPETIGEPARFNAERYGLFLELSYHEKKHSHDYLWSMPVKWKGLFIGGNLGGAWGKSYWSDPFGPTPADPGLTNAAGFGDQIRSTGPLGGIDININGQTNQFIYGVGTSLQVADIRGENTLFSGIGGVNGQTVINRLATFVGRLGVNINRSLLYVNGGRALLYTQYRLNANTAALNLGKGNPSNYAWGWTGGIGVAYALDEHWVTNVEYNYIHVPPQNVSFPTVALINSKSISTNQTLNMFKIGVDYKFNIF